MKDKLVDVYEECGCGVLLLCILLVLAIAFGILCFEGWLLMLVWNYAIVAVFNAPPIGFWIAVCLVWLLNLISKAFTIKVNKN